MANARKPAEKPPEELLLASEQDAPGGLSVEAAVLAEFNQADDQDRWTVTVARFIAYGKPEEFCFECAPTDFPIIGKIQEQFGAGMYVVRARRNGVIVRGFRYAIAEPKVKPVDPVRSEIGSLASALTGALERQGQQIERLFERINERPREGGNSEKLSDLVATMVSLKDMMGLGQPQPQQGANTVLEFFKLGLEARESSGGGGDSGGLLGFAERMLNSPIIKQMMESAAAAPAPTMRAPALNRPAGPQPQQQPGEAAPQASQEQNDQIANFMRQQILYLMGRAHQWQTSGNQKSHPDLYAEWVLDNIPLEILEPILALPDPMAALLMYVPEAKDHGPWFLQLLDSVRDELTDGGAAVDNGQALNGSAGQPQHVPSPAQPSSSVNS